MSITINFFERAEGPVGFFVLWYCVERFVTQHYITNMIRLQ